MLFLVLGAGCATAGMSTPTREATQWIPVEWTLENPTFSGNPFDLGAEARFVHRESGERRVTGMFYDGEASWKFRFTGTRPGTWTFTTHAEDPDLAGRSGTVEVAPNPGGYGFIGGVGNRWVRQRGVAGEPEAFVPQIVMYETPQSYHRKPEMVDADIQEFLARHGFTGLHTPVFCRWFDLETERCGDLPESEPNPDPRTFEALEMLISKTHAAGGMVHLWLWGDNQRTQTPMKWGFNSDVDRRLQRYIAARLGPLPGWTAGYGFDLWEWVDGPELSAWHDYMHEQMGWDHMLGARSEKNKLTQLSEDMDYASYEQHRPDYEMYVRTIERRPTKPAFSEDRFRIRESERYAGKDYDLEMTRRGLWHSAMAGGVANIWGYLHRPTGAEEREGSYPYPNPEAIRTYATFMDPRFSLDLRRANELIGEGHALRADGHDRLIAYAEDVRELTLDLSGFTGPVPLVAVDTKAPYRELDLGEVDPGRRLVSLPRRSDWAVAAGEF